MQNELASAQDVIRDTVNSLFGAAVDRVFIGPAEDHNVDPAFSIIVYMRPQQPFVSGSRLLDTIGAAKTALEKIGDPRFPFVTFRAPENSPAEDPRGEET